MAYIDMSKNNNVYHYEKKMFNEYGYIFCERCITSQSFAFSVHHIFFKSEKPKHKNLNHEDNLIMLCADCHRELHNKKYKRQELEKFNKAKQLFI